MSVQFCAHTSLHTRVFSVSPPSPPPAYRTVQNRFPIISTTCLFNIFLALTVITLLLLIVAIAGSAFKVHETRKQCFPSVNAELSTKDFEYNLQFRCIFLAFLCQPPRTRYLKKFLFPAISAKSAHIKSQSLFGPSPLFHRINSVFIIGWKEFITTNTVRRTHWFNCSQTGTIQTTFSQQVVSFSQS